MINKKQRIIELLLEYPQGLKAREISEKLPYIDKHEVNQILYSNLSDFVAVDYVWKLAGSKAKTFSNESEYKKEEIDCLCRIYHTPYFQTQKLADLDLQTFKIAVEHAKELYNRDQLSYTLTESWYSIVTMPEKTFRETVTRLIAQRRIDSERRISKIIEERQKKQQEEQQAKRQREMTMIATRNSLIYEAQNRASGKDHPPVRRCTGNCSTCTRDECIEKSKNI